MTVIALPTRPQSYGEIFSTAYQIAQKTFAKTFPMLLLLFISSYPVQFIGRWIDYSNKMNNVGMSFIGTLGILVLIFIVYALFGAAIYRIHSLVKKQDPGFGESFGFGCKKVIPLVAVALLYTLAVVFGLVLLIIPGIMLSIYLIFSIYLLYLDFGILDSMKESYRLVKDNWWRTAINITLLTLAIFLAALLFVGIMAILTIGLQLMLGSVIQLGDNVLFKIVIAICAAILMIFIYNYSIAFMLTCIYDLQIRRSQK